MIQLNVEVGKTGHYDLRVDNFKKDKVAISYELSNPKYFYIDDCKTLHPGENNLKLRFTPSSEGKEHCIIRVYG